MILQKNLREKLETMSLTGLFIQAVITAGLFVLGIWVNSKTILSFSVYSVCGVFIWLLTFIHTRQLRLADEESRVDIMPADKNANLFHEEPETQLFSSERKLIQFEKWFLAVSVSILGVILIISGYLFLINSIRLPFVLVDASKLNLVSVFLSAAAFFSFVSGRFFSGFSSGYGNSYILKGGSGWLLSVSIWAFLLALSFTLNYFGYGWAVKFMLYATPCLSILIGCDLILAIILDFYRPRVKGQIQKPLYQCFCIGLLAEPKGIFKAVAHSIDYQFGFKISQTWFYKFIEKVIAPAMFFQIIGLYACTAVAIINPHERGIIERFGVPLNQKGALMPGIHLKLPWPIEKLRVVPYSRIQSVFINQPDSGEDIILWSVEHHKDRKMILLPSKENSNSDQSDNDSVSGVPVSWLSVSAEIQYKVGDPFLYVYNQKKPQSIVYHIAWRELIKYASKHDFFEFMSRERMNIGGVLKEKIQNELDKLKSGVIVVFVGVYELHPPAEVAESFESVIGSIEEKQSKILTAEIYEKKILPRAEAEGKSIISGARSYSLKKKTLAESEMIQFQYQDKAYGVSPILYLWREYLSAIKEALMNTKKVIISNKINTGQTSIIDLQDKRQPDLLDLSMPSEEDENDG